MFVSRLMNKKPDMLNVIDMLHFRFDRWKSQEKCNLGSTRVV